MNSFNSPDDYYEYTNAQGRKSRRFKDTPDDFLLEAEENVQQIANLMMQTLDMMIDMQKNGQQQIVEDPEDVEPIRKEHFGYIDAERA